MASRLPALPAASPFRVEKTRVEAALTLSTGDRVSGRFFVAQIGAHGSAPERVVEILNAEEGFVPFEIDEGATRRTVLFNRTRIVTVALAYAEAEREPGYDVATECPVSIQLTDGRVLQGAVRIHRPQGRDRLSDWTRNRDRFRYLEVEGVTMIVNVAHVVELREDVEL